MCISFLKKTIFKIYFEKASMKSTVRGALCIVPFSKR